MLRMTVKRDISSNKGQGVFLFLVLLTLGLYFSYRAYRHFNPVTISLPPRPEVEITIIPGWNLRQVAEYLVLKGLASSTSDVYALTGKPAFFYNYQTGPAPHLHKKVYIEVYRSQSYEGFLAPETYRVFKDATIRDILEKFVAERDSQFTTSTYERIQQMSKQGQFSMFRDCIINLF